MTKQKAQIKNNLWQSIKNGAQNFLEMLSMFGMWTITDLVYDYKKSDKQKNTKNSAKPEEQE